MLNRIIFTFVIILFSSNAYTKIIHSERSLYQNIIIEDKRDLRCLKFTVKRETSSQSCFKKSDPKKLVFSYTKMLFSGLLLNPNPERVLIIGLGGGTVSNTLLQLYPNITIDNIEIDPAVVKVAKDYFGYIDNEQIRTITKDGRIFVKRALIKKQNYDWIILDAFNGDYIPEHLMTSEFLTEIKQLLTPNGILSANTFSISKLYQYESATYHAVFGNFFNVRERKSGNRIILATKSGTLPNEQTLLQRAEKLEKPLSAYGVNIFKVMSNMKTKKDWPEQTPLLTDQYSPANLLQ